MITEFEFIDHIKSRFYLDKVGDDCAVLPLNEENDMVITSDMLVEDVDFRLEWTTPELLGHKSLAVSLSDIAAMGAAGSSSLLSIAIPVSLWDTDFLERFYDGWHALADLEGIELVGGDLSRSTSGLVIDSIVIGKVMAGKAVLRSGARPGDAIFVTGFLGGAAAGLFLLKNGFRLSDLQTPPVRHNLLRHLQPLPQHRTAKVLREERLATSMIDVSDGLSSDLHHLLDASGVGCRIYRDRIPIDPAIVGIEDFDCLSAALNGGEDFELLMTVSPANISAANDLGFHYIGEITDRKGVAELVSADSIQPLRPLAFRHF